MPANNTFLGSDIINIKFFASGYCTASAKIINIKSDQRLIKFYATWCLIRHKVYGNILFDTGYSERFFSATKNYPDKIYSIVTPVYINEKDTAKALLQKEGIPAIEVNYIIISHFHADHIAGLKDFPNAQFICSANALEELNSLRGIRAVKKGILKQLLPRDFASRVLLIEDISSCYIDPGSDLTFYKLFNLESLQLVFLPGHARGMLGLFIYSNQGKLLFATDAAWNTSAFEKKILPKKIVRLFFDSWPDYKETYDKLSRFKNDNPGIEILFTHCPRTLNYVSNVI